MALIVCVPEPVAMSTSTFWSSDVNCCGIIRSVLPATPPVPVTTVPVELVDVLMPVMV